MTIALTHIFNSATEAVTLDRTEAVFLLIGFAMIGFLLAIAI